MLQQFYQQQICGKMVKKNIFDNKILLLLIITRPLSQQRAGPTITFSFYSLT
ncbi:hypothetical protein Hanom_Chr05g00410751 [Helianthus anomalus]